MILTSILSDDRHFHVFFSFWQVERKNMSQVHFRREVIEYWKIDRWSKESITISMTSKSVAQSSTCKFQNDASTTRTNSQDNLDICIQSTDICHEPDSEREWIRIPPIVHTLTSRWLTQWNTYCPRLKIFTIEILSSTWLSVTESYPKYCRLHDVNFLTLETWYSWLRTSDIKITFSRELTRIPSKVQNIWYVFFVDDRKRCELIESTYKRSEGRSTRPFARIWN